MDLMEKDAQWVCQPILTNEFVHPNKTVLPNKSILPNASFLQIQLFRMSPSFQTYRPSWWSSITMIRRVTDHWHPNLNPRKRTKLGGTDKRHREGLFWDASLLRDSHQSASSRIGSHREERRKAKLRQHDATRHKNEGSGLKGKHKKKENQENRPDNTSRNENAKWEGH